MKKRLSCLRPALCARLARRGAAWPCRTSGAFCSHGALRRVAGFTGAWALLAGAATLFADDAAHAFLWEQANARLAAAQQPADFQAAARDYNRLVQEGVRNGPLFFNLGTALLLAGDAGSAATALERAECYDGCTPDIRTNLRLALASGKGPDRDWPWHRVAFFWHYEHPIRLRLLVALGGWLLLWIGIALRQLARSGNAEGLSRTSAWKRRTSGLASLCVSFGILLALCFGASAGVSLLRETQREQAWRGHTFDNPSQPERAP